MTEKITTREYTIPLRRFWFGARTYERTSRAVKAIKQFIAKHMKVEDRDLDKVKLDVYLNNEVWYKGRATPPSKVKVRAVKEGDIVKVTFLETPAHVKFASAKHARRHKAAEKSKTPSSEVKPEEKTEEQKTDEKEKETSTAIAKETEIKQDINAAKHTTKFEKAVHPQRMALKK
ncbi:MAG: 50S ribosomal protein L31e [Nanoarchaeota archaeon]